MRSKTDHLDSGARAPATPVDARELSKPRVQTPFSAIVQRASADPRSLTRAEVAQLQRTIGNAAVAQMLTKAAPHPNQTGMPDGLKAGVEALSGLAMDDVRVHYNSPSPARLQALAYAQSPDIHLAPGQEKHLPHEAWHVVQQKQGRVKPTLQMKGVAINDDDSLEREADRLGAQAENTQLTARPSARTIAASGSRLQTVEPTYPIGPIESWEAAAGPATVAHRSNLMQLLKEDARKYILKEGMLLQPKNFDYWEIVYYARARYPGSDGLVAAWNLNQPGRYTITPDMLDEPAAVDLDKVAAMLSILARGFDDEEQLGVEAEAKESKSIGATPTAKAKPTAKVGALEPGKYYDWMKNPSDLIKALETDHYLLAKYGQPSGMSVINVHKTERNVKQLNFSNVKAVHNSLRQQIVTLMSSVHIRPQTPEHQNEEENLPKGRRYFEMGMEHGEGARIVIDATNGDIYFSYHYGGRQNKGEANSPFTLLRGLDPHETAVPRYEVIFFKIEEEAYELALRDYVESDAWYENTRAMLDMLLQEIETLIQSVRKMDIKGFAYVEYIMRKSLKRTGDNYRAAAWYLKKCISVISDIGARKSV